MREHTAVHTAARLARNARGDAAVDSKCDPDYGEIQNLAEPCSPSGPVVCSLLMMEDLCLAEQGKGCVPQHVQYAHSS